MLKNKIKLITAFAPASSSNLAVGYDILGFPFNTIGDEVTLIFNDSNKITISSIDSLAKLPKDPLKNTATHALIAMTKYLNLNIGIEVKIKKGIPLCSGLGGSAASAVAAVFALNQCLKVPLSKNELAKFAIDAEGLASGERHADNVVPSLWGQLTMVRQLDKLDVITLPMPKLFCILIHPELEISTKAAREALAKDITLKRHTLQAANLASFISSIYQSDWQLLKRSCQDLIIEPQRQHLLKGFKEVQQAAINSGSLCCSFSGAGPTMFALTNLADVAATTAHAMTEQFRKLDVKSHAWMFAMQEGGPKILDVKHEI